MSRRENKKAPPRGAQSSMDPLPDFDGTPRIAIVIDNPLRDLPGACLMALELIDRGCKAFLVPMYLNEEIFSLAPDMVLLNYLRKVSNALATHMGSNHIPYGVLDTEGGPSGDIDAKYITSLCDDAAINDRLAFACCWGPEIAGALKRKKFYAAEKIIVTGNPRFDLYGEPWRQAVIEFADDCPGGSEEFILICSNFGLTNSQYGKREQIRENLSKYYSYPHSDIDEMFAEEDKAIEQFTVVITMLAREFPDRKFVYRPHPFEALSFYQERFDGLPNVSVIKRGAVTGWMINAKAVIQLNCTTCYDAWFARTPSLKPAWIEQKAAFGPDLSINCPCPDMESLFVSLRAVLDDTFEGRMDSDQRALGLVHRFFGEPDGRSHKRVADVILNHLDLELRKKRLHSLRRIRLPTGRAASKWPRFLVDLVSHATRLAGFQLIWNLRNVKSRRAWVAKHDASEKSFEITEVRKIIAALARAKGVVAPKVESAWKAGEFAFGGRFSRTIAILPAPAVNSRGQK